jgi:hypothetical protein
MGIDWVASGGFTTPRSPVTGGRITPFDRQSPDAAGDLGCADGSQGSAPAGDAAECAWGPSAGPRCATAMAGAMPASAATASRSKPKVLFHVGPLFHGLLSFASALPRPEFLPRQSLRSKGLTLQTSFRLNRQSGSQLVRRCRKLRLHVQTAAEAKRCGARCWCNSRDPR